MKLLLSLLFLAVATNGGDSDFKKCIKPKSVPVPLDILENKNWTVIMHSNCENCKHNNSLATFAGRTGFITKCWNLRYEGKRGKGFSAPILCTYAEVDYKFHGEGKCELQTRKTKPKLGGGHIIFDTDEKTYIVGSICLYGKENFWYIATIKDRMDSKLIHRIKRKIHKAGFSTHNIAIRGIDDVVFTGFELTDDCNAV